VPEHGDMDMSDRYELYRYEDGRMKYIGNYCCPIKLR